MMHRRAVLIYRVQLMLGNTLQLLLFEESLVLMLALFTNVLAQLRGGLSPDLA